jgi:alpha-methylacyl-CoA racemase
MLEGTDVCFGPVLNMDEAAEHPHMKARGAFVRRDGVVQPAPAPRLSRTPGGIQDNDQDGAQALQRWAREGQP